MEAWRDAGRCDKVQQGIEVLEESGMSVFVFKNNFYFISRLRKDERWKKVH